MLENINSTVDLIEAEEADDFQKKTTCEKETSFNEAKRDDKKEKMDELEGSISELEISAKNTRTSIASTEESLAENRADQKEATDARNEQNAVFKTNLKNLQDAEKILAKATKVLVKYYKYLHSHTAEKTYKEVDGKDSGGGNLRQITPGFSDPAKIDLELQKACSEEPECVAYNSAGWLKSSLAPESEWYEWDGGKLFIKELNGVPATEAGTELVQTKHKSKQPADVDFETEDAEFADSQSGNGNKVIDMLNFIAGETEEEKKTAISTEESAQDTFDDEMKTAKDAEQGMMEAIDGFKLDLADTEKSLQEAEAELSTTTDEHTATVKYLDDIFPGCNFIMTKYDERKAAREAEKAALANAVSTLKATPIFQRFLAEAEKEAMGKCAALCEGEKESGAECQACLQGVSVFGYCVTNPDTPGSAAQKAAAPLISNCFWTDIRFRSGSFQTCQVLESISCRTNTCSDLPIHKIFGLKLLVNHSSWMFMEIQSFSSHDHVSCYRDFHGHGPLLVSGQAFYDGEASIKRGWPGSNCGSNVHSSLP